METYHKLREDILLDVNKQLTKFRNEMLNEVKSLVKATMTSDSVKKHITVGLRNVIEDTKKEIIQETNKKQIMPAHAGTVAVSEQLTRLEERITKAVALKVGSEVARVATKQAVDTVISTINKEVMPKIDNAMQLLNYQNEDVDYTINSYRRSIMDLAEEDEKLALTDGRSRQYRWGPNNADGLFFDE